MVAKSAIDKHLVMRVFSAACAGDTLGTRYALNTPGFFGCAGSSAAVLGYKMALEPGAIQTVLGFIPMSIALAALAYLALEVKEKVRGVASRESGLRRLACKGFVKRDHCTTLRAVQHPSMTPTSLQGT